jgi:DeoR/GlpR family transcriptional regulator of sugar metabolism
MAERTADEPVFADERQARMAEHVATRGRARIGELAELFGVTEPTVRKDLSALQERGLLKRTHGGALALHPVIDREFAGRKAINPAGKEAIARACVDLLRDGDSVFLDSGTTVDAVVRALAARNRQGDGPRLSVLTNTLEVARTLAEVPGADCVLLGGQLRHVDGSVVGALALENLQRFAFSLAFIGVSGFSEDGLSVGSISEAAVKAAAIDRARRVVVPLERSKVGVTDFARIAGLDEVDAVVLDAATPAVAELCESHGIELVAAAG